MVVSVYLFGKSNNDIGQVSHHGPQTANVLAVVGLAERFGLRRDSVERLSDSGDVHEWSFTAWDPCNQREMGAKSSV